MIFPGLVKETKIMKKMVRLLSLVMLIAMCFSLVSVGAYAAPAVIVPNSSSGNSSSSGSAVFSYGTNILEQEAIINSSDTFVTESDGRIKSDGRDPSIYVQDVDTAVSDAVSELVSKYAADVNINNDTNPYYFTWLMNKFVNGEVDYSNSDNEIATARALFGEFIDEAATNLATTAAAQEVLEENAELKEAVEAVADETVEETVEQAALAEQAEKQIEQVAEEIIEKIENIDSGASASGASSSLSLASFKSAVSGVSSAAFKKTSYDLSSGDLHKAITKNGSVNVENTQTLTTAYTGDIVFDFQNCTMTSDTPSAYIVEVKSGLFKFKNGTVNGSFIHVTGGSVILDNMKVNVPSSGQQAVCVESGYADINRSNYFTSESPYSVVAVNGGNVIIDGFIYSSPNGTYGIKITGGKVTKNDGELLSSDPNSDIVAPTGVYIDGGTFIFNGGTITGTAAADGGTGAAICVKGGKVCINDGTTGCILSQYNAAIWAGEGDGTGTNGDISVADLDFLEDATGHKSDVNEDNAGITIATVNGTGFSNLQEAIEEAISSKYSVEIVNDVDLSGGATINGNVVINGNGHTLRYGGTIFNVTDGNVVIKDLTLDELDINNSLIIISGGDVTIKDVITDNCQGACLENQGGKVTVDGLDCEESGTGTIGIKASDGTTTVYDLVTKSEAPVAPNSEGVTVYQAECKVPGADVTLEEFKADTQCGAISACKASGSTEELSKGIYYITAKEVTASIASGGSSDGSYLYYDKAKGNENVLQIEASDKVDSITVYGENGIVKEITFNESISSSKNLVTLVNKVLDELPAGKYDLSVKFKNSGAVTIPLYVSPNIVTEATSKEKTDMELTKYDTTNKIWQYDAQSHEDGWIKIPKDDIPLHVGLGPDQDSVIWISDECIGVDADKDGIVEPGEVKLLHDDLDHLGNGTNYVWLDYGSYWIPIPFTVYNAAATITPTTTDWNRVDGDKVFTVWPDVLTVKINGESLESDDEYTYKDGKLTIKSSFLKKLANGDYTLEVSTSKGGVYSDLTIGEVLRPKTIDYHVYGGSKGITFVGSNTIDYTQGLWIGKTNKTQIPEQYYTINSDNTFTLSADYLNRFSTLGTYYISATVGEQYCTTTFRIISASQAAYNPSTGDSSNIVMWAVILVLAAVVIVVILIPTLKKKAPVEKAEEVKNDIEKKN